MRAFRRTNSLYISFCSLMKKLSYLLFLISLFLIPLTSESQSTLPKGSALSVEDSSGIFLVSTNTIFTCGFYEIGTNAYVFSTWFSNSADRTIAWTANRDRPVNGHGSKIAFRDDGSMALIDVDDTVVWSTNTSSPLTDSVQLSDAGNLVIKESNGNILWQSFDSPTDTLLPSQPITKDIKLVSAAAKGSVSSGYYNFIFDDNNVMTLQYDGPEISSIYWPNPDYSVFQNGRTKYNSSRYGVLDEQGQFLASDRLAFGASDMGSRNITRRITLDYDGNLRLYSLNAITKMWSISWQAFAQVCPVHGLCGKNGICSYTQSKTVCSCAPGYEMSDREDWRKGCKPKFNISCEKAEVKFVKLLHTDFWGYDLNYTGSISLKRCKNLCRRDCSCEAVEYKVGGGDCYTKNILYNGRSTPDNPGTLYLKVPKSIMASRMSALEAHEITCSSTDANNNLDSSDIYRSKDGSTRWDYFYWFLLAIGLTEFLFVAFGWWFIFRREKKPTLLEEGYKMISSQFRRFTYKELRRTTQNFKEELGRGGSGAVYKGVLDDKRVVAVKKLEDVIQAEEEFWAEVRVIGQIYHMNLVRMWGFCSERSRRLLVYEYVENGSLGKHLFGNKSSLSWHVRFKVVLGVAKALAYLHHECLEWVIHCDMKPENILLDSNFEPKIADFGLAKLSKRGGVGSSVTQIRGTRGYMAPEWTSNLPITAKADVYSFGVVLLDVVMGSRASEWTTSRGNEGEHELMGLVRLLKVKLERGEEAWVGDFVDGRLRGEFNRKQALLMVEIAVSCLEEERRRRPTMDSVAQLLQSCDG